MTVGDPVASQVCPLRVWRRARAFGGVWRGSLGLALACLWLACSPAYSIRRPVEARVPVTRAGLTLSARFEGERSGTPAQFPDFVPVVVELRNQSAGPVRVRAADFSLVNESGSRFLPLPTLAGRGLLMASSSGPIGAHLPPGPNGARLPSQYQLAASRAVATYVIEPRGSFWRGRESRTQVIDNQRVSSFPSRGMDTISLAEGVLKPGDRRIGYVYFSRHVRRRGGLRLDWDARSEGGERVAVLSIDAEVSVAE